jgi:hypothetical protein
MLLPFLLALSSCRSGKRSHTGQVVRCLSQQKELVDSLQTSVHRLANPANGLAPSKHLFDALAFALTDFVARPSRRSSVNRGTTRTRIVLRHMRCNIVCAARCHEAGCVVVLVRADRNGRTGKSRSICKHLCGRIPLGRAVGLRDLCVHHEAMPVVGQHVAHVAKHRARATTLAKKSRLIVGTGFVCIVATLLAAPVLLRAGTAVRRRVVIRFLPGVPG